MCIVLTQGWRRRKAYPDSHSSPASSELPLWKLQPNSQEVKTEDSQSEEPGFETCPPRSRGQAIYNTGSVFALVK